MEHTLPSYVIQGTGCQKLRQVYVIKCIGEESLPNMQLESPVLTRGAYKAWSLLYTRSR